MEVNESVMFLNIFLICVRFINRMWNFYVLGLMIGKYNVFFDLLEIILNFNYIVYVGYYF